MQEFDIFCTSCPASDGLFASALHQLGSWSVH